MFEKELSFFISNQEDLVKKYRGKVLVIKDQQIIGVYRNTIEAYLQAQKKYILGTFMIQPCIPGPSAYTVNITSTKVVNF